MKQRYDKHQEMNDSDVVVIEEHKAGFYWVALLGVLLGLAVGGFIGDNLSSTKWREAYQKIELKLADSNQTVEKYKQNLEKLSQSIIEAQQKQQEVKVEVVNQEELKLKANLSILEETNQTLKTKNAAMNRQNEELDSQVESLNATVDQLNNQVGLQLTMLSRAKALFQRQLVLKEKVIIIEQELDTLPAKIKRMTADCQAYESGKGWDSASDSCNALDSLKQRRSELNQELDMHNMDINEIDSISESLGM